MGTNGSLPAYQSQLPVAVDATGGDKGIEVMVEGAVQAYHEFGARSVLVGPEQKLKAILESMGAAKLPISVCHASQEISMTESPSRAVLKKPDSSLVVAYKLVQSGSASSIISAGNSGAMMAAGILNCGLMAGIKRPAIATLIPGQGDARPNVILDSGATVDCDAQNLVQFAIMGAIYYGALFSVARPKVGLLSNGEEENKGTDVTRAAAMVLKQLPVLKYVGYVEGRDVVADRAQVIVCDGFVGNIVLKTMEGCVQLLSNQLEHEGKKGIFRRIGLGLTKHTRKQVFNERFDYAAHGGAPLLGLKKLAIVLHGSSESRAVKNAVRVADSFARLKVTDKISLELSALEDSSFETLQQVIETAFVHKGKMQPRAAVTPEVTEPTPDKSTKSAGGVKG